MSKFKKITSPRSATFVPPKKQNKGKGLHPLNPHRNGYDFEKLVQSSPGLAKFIRPNPYGNLSIDFGNPEAVKALNSALLYEHYQIDFWDIPEGYLCPPVPGRADYIHYLADLLSIKTHKSPQLIRVLDIGTGANGIYPIIGVKSYGWSFVASDIDPISLTNFKKIISKNPALFEKIELRQQVKSTQIFDGIIQSTDNFDITMCNPPFHRSLEDAQLGSERKVRNLAKNRIKQNRSFKNSLKDKINPLLNFGGQKAELWCEGGEQQFILNMIKESQNFASQCTWFTTLVSKKQTLSSCYKALKGIQAKEVKTIEMTQGQKITRILAWQL